MTTYEPALHSLNQHPLPAWFDDAKLGIFIHWGLYSVPGWAPTSAGDLGEVPFEEWFKNNSYAEWYLNTLRIDNSPTQKYHQEVYGEDFNYYEFARTFNNEVATWNPDEMASLFSAAGAHYVVLTSKHHDGFLMWPSEIDNPHLESEYQSTERDLVGELADAVRARDMRFGLYYSGGIDWSFKPTVITNLQKLVAAVPLDSTYIAYSDGHWRELIERYQPAILWNDIAYPSVETRRQLFADYYNAFPQGVVNNRWSSPAELQEAPAESGLTSTAAHADFTTPEYAQYEEITATKWESTRGIGHSFGYNRQEGDENMLTVDELVDSFVDIVSKNGNLLLNVGPKADGTIPNMQAERLRGLGDWLATNSEAIFGTRPWVVAEGRTRCGVELRFTQKDTVTYAILLETPAERSVVIEDVEVAEDSEINLLGHSGTLRWYQDGHNLIVDLPEKMNNAVAYGLRISPTPRHVKR
jgi:alpha-L-fucosidase